MSDQPPPEEVWHPDPARRGTIHASVPIGCASIEATPEPPQPEPVEVGREPLLVARTMDDVERMLRRG